MNPTSPLGTLQKKRLGELASLGLCNDDSLSAHLNALGQPSSSAMLAKYRQGRRAAPLGLLDMVLGHCTTGERIAVLELWARPHRLAVTTDEVLVAGRDVLGWVMEIGVLLGQCLHLARGIVGRLPTNDERLALRKLAVELRRGAAQLELLTMEAGASKAVA